MTKPFQKILIVLIALLAALPGQVGAQQALGDLNAFRISDYVYVVSGTDPEIIQVHVERERVQRQIRLPAIPTGVVVSEEHALIVATDPATRGLWYLDPATRQLTLNLTLDIEPTLIALHPDETLIAVADWTLGVAEFYSLPNGRLLGRVEGLESAHELRFGPDPRLYGDKLYVSMTDRPEVAVIDLETFAVSRRLQLPGKMGIEQLAISPTQPIGFAMPVPSDEAIVHVIDLVKDEAIGLLEFDEPVNRAFFDVFGKYVFFPELYRGTVHVYEPREKRFTEPMEFDGPIDSITSGFLGSIIYALSGEAKVAWGFDLATFDRIDTIQLPGRDPDTMVTHEQSGKIFITIEDEMEIVIVDTRVPAGKLPNMRMMWVPDKMPMQVVVPGTLAFCQ
ncbi:MAG: hypothetical protein AAGA50_04540 [Pseudomonadota bacterium]